MYHCLTLGYINQHFKMLSSQQLFLRSCFTAFGGASRTWGLSIELSHLLFPLWQFLNVLLCHYMVLLPWWMMKSSIIEIFCVEFVKTSILEFRACLFDGIETWNGNWSDRFSLLVFDLRDWHSDSHSRGSESPKI